MSLKRGLHDLSMPCMTVVYSETCLNRTSSWLRFCSVLSGSQNIQFDMMVLKTCLVYTGNAHENNCLSFDEK